MQIDISKHSRKIREHLSDTRQKFAKYRSDQHDLTAMLRQETLILACADLFSAIFIETLTIYGHYLTIGNIGRHEASRTGLEGPI